MFRLLAENYKDQHEKLVSIILKATPADKIYLLGATHVKRRTESIFMSASPCINTVNSYYILALVSNEDDLNTVQDKIEKACRHFIPVTAIVLHTSLFNNWITVAHQFACTVSKIAVQIHGDPETELVDCGIPDEQAIKTAKETAYNQGLNKVVEFLAGADLYRIRRQNKMSAFMLYQAAGYALRTLLKITTGLSCNTHNLDKLIRYCSMISHKLPEIFPGDNERDSRLFQLLKRTNINTHNKEDYSIPANDLLIITKKVRQIQHVIQDLYNSGLPQ